MASNEARSVRLLYIDDNPPAVQAPMLDVTTLRSLREVQSWLIDARRPSADLVVCDVNMSHRAKDHPDGVRWGEDGALPAYGPLLALPFVTSDAVCEFVPASSWWAQVRSDGYVLISVALLLTVIARRPYDMAEAQEWIDEQGSQRALLNYQRGSQSPTAITRGSPDPLIAISSGLIGLRKKLVAACEEGRLTLAGLGTTLGVLEDWKEGEMIEGDGGPARIEIIYPDRSDFVAVSSLFADTMMFTEVPNGAQVERMADELRLWLARDECFRFPRTINLYEKAVDLLIDILPREVGNVGGAVAGQNHLKARAKAATKTTELDPYLLIRTTMIFAFLRAWYFDRILDGGYQEEDETFGLREWAYWFLDIDPSGKPQNPFKRLLGVDDGTSIRVSEEWHRRAFDPSAKKTFGAYVALERDKRLNLTPVEKSLGRRFLADSERFFPKGVRSEHRRLWEPHLDEDMPSYPGWLS